MAYSTDGGSDPMTLFEAWQIPQCWEVMLFGGVAVDQTKKGLSVSAAQVRRRFLIAPLPVPPHLSHQWSRLAVSRAAMVGQGPVGELAMADLDAEGRWVKDWTRDFALFAGLDEALRHAVEAEVEWLGLPGGRVLFEAGEPGEAMFLVLSGTLGVVGAAGEDKHQLVAHIHAGETLGEMSLLTDRPVSVTIVALRDCILARLGRPAFERVVAQNPALLRTLGAQVVSRFEQAMRRARPVDSHRTLAVMPVVTGPDAAAEFAAALGAALAAQGHRVHRLRAATAIGQDADAFHAIEAAHDLTIYEGDGGGGAWDALCARRGDRVLLVAEGRAAPPERGPDALPWRPYELVLLQDGATASPPPAEAWLLRLGVETHHHVRRGNPADLARLARHLTGKAVGVVFSGGGARGYGHLGVVKALREAGVPMDLVGGTSFGAIVAAGVASEWDDAELRARFHDAFARSHPLRAYAWPAVARAAMVGSVTPGQLGRTQAQLVLEPPLPGMHLLDWKALDHAVEAGYRYALGRIEKLHALASGAGQGSTVVARDGHDAG